MSPAQLGMYRAESAKAVKAMRARGHTGTDTELRHQLTREALGRDVSSLAFTNTQFDRVLAVLWSHCAADNLDGQLRQIDQPILRLQWMCKQHLTATGMIEEKQDWYLIGIGRRMFPGKMTYALTTFSEDEWRDILVACNKHRVRCEAKASATRGDPF